MNKRLLVIGLIVFGSLPALGFLLLFTYQYGYCHGWWGKENLQLRARWLCSCPPAFEQTLYPDHIDVMFSACDNVFVSEVTGGRYIYVSGDDSYPIASAYLLDPLTNDKLPFTLPAGVSTWEFLTDELVLGRPRGLGVTERYYTIWNLRNNQSAQITWPASEIIPPPYLPDGTVNPELIELFDTAQQAFFTSPGTVVVIGPDLWNRPEQNFVLSEGLLPEEEAGWLKDVVEASGVPTVDVRRVAEGTVTGLPSPSGLYIARQDGIYEVDTERLIAPMYQVVVRTGLITPTNCSSSGDCFPGYFPCCWLADDSAVLYRFEGTSVVDFGLSRWDVGAPRENSTNFWMPVLKVNLPESN